MAGMNLRGMYGAVPVVRKLGTCWSVAVENHGMKLYTSFKTFKQALDWALTDGWAYFHLWEMRRGWWLYDPWPTLEDARSELKLLREECRKYEKERDRGGADGDL